MSQEFNDISITGVDEAKTLTNNINGVMYRVHVSLSERPSSMWGELFAAAWKFPRHSMWRRAHVTGHYIVIECPIDEMNRYHKTPLSDVAAEVNLQYRKYLAESRAREERERREQEAADQRAKDAMRNIKF